MLSIYSLSPMETELIAICRHLGWGTEKCVSADTPVKSKGCELGGRWELVENLEHSRERVLDSVAC